MKNCRKGPPYMSIIIDRQFQDCCANLIFTSVVKQQNLAIKWTDNEHVIKMGDDPKMKLHRVRFRKNTPLP